MAVELTVVMRFEVAPDTEALEEFLETKLGCDVLGIEQEDV